jgi:hypothetical protein
MARPKPSIAAATSEGTTKLADTKAALHSAQS